MSAAWELVSMIEANGGQFLIDGEELVVRPGDAAMPVLEELRQFKREIIALLQSRTAIPADDLFDGEWMLERCVYLDRWWGGVGCLYLDLAGWLAEHGRPVPLSRLALVQALQREGFQVTSDGLVRGLCLKSDVEAHLRFQNPQEAGTAVQKRRTRKNNDYPQQKPQKCAEVPAKSSALLRTKGA